LKILPGFNFLEGIFSHDKIKGDRILFTEISDCINRIGFPRPFKFDIGSGELEILSNSSPHHLEAVVGLNNLFSHFVGRQRSRNEDHLLESKGLPNLFGSPKVTQVNRIESTPKQPDPFFDSRTLNRKLLLRESWENGMME
jgi:hypothetical protein